MAATRIDQTGPPHAGPGKRAAAAPRLLSLFNYLLVSVEAILRDLAIDEPECVRLLAELDWLADRLHPGNACSCGSRDRVDPNGRSGAGARRCGAGIHAARLRPAGRGRALRVRQVSRASHDLMLRKLARPRPNATSSLTSTRRSIPAERAAIGFVLAVRPFTFSVFEAIARRDAARNPRRARGSAA
jgi:hypothetical protein